MTGRHTYTKMVKQLDSSVKYQCGGGLEREEGSAVSYGGKGERGHTIH